MTAAARFHVRLKRGGRLLGTFLKTPGVHATEILGAVGYDFLVVDQEHGPFDLAVLDILALAARAGDTPCLVRVADTSPARIGGVLDMGFAGIIAPHVTSADVARLVARACRHRPGSGSRGFSNSTRAGGYGGLRMAAHIDEADRSVTVVAMIEDAAALDELDAIVSTEGIDAVLIGRADLAVSLGETTTDAPVVTHAVDQVLAACRRADVPAFVFASDVAEAEPFARRGAKGFIIGSDQALLRRAAREIEEQFRRTIAD